MKTGFSFPPPCKRLTLVMPDGENDYFIVFHCIKNTERETLYYSTPVTPAHNGILVGVTCNGIQFGFNRKEEIFAQAMPLLVIPQSGFSGIFGCTRGYNQNKTHVFFRMLFLTSSQLSTLPGLFLYSS